VANCFFISDTLHLPRELQSLQDASFQYGTTNRTPEFLAKFPLGKVRIVNFKLISNINCMNLSLRVKVLIKVELARLRHKIQTCQFVLMLKTQQLLIVKLLKIKMCSISLTSVKLQAADS